LIESKMKENFIEKLAGATRGKEITENQNLT
jgi:hypothetical protein